MSSRLGGGKQTTMPERDSERAALLRTGASVPRIGLGVFRTPRGAATQAAVESALALGYRHVDTARVYGNEADVAEAIRRSGIPREEVFITTKLWNEDQGADTTRPAFEASLARMQLDYVDLFLLHWPVAGKRLASWSVLEALHAEGRARAIGVSNFMVPHLEELAAHASVLPHVNQIEASPFHQQADVRAWCRERDILVEAYSPLTKGRKLDHPVVTEVASAVGCTPAQVLLRWCLERELVPLPKSMNPERQRENLETFALSLGEAQLAALDALDEGLTTGWDPRGAP